MISANRVVLGLTIVFALVLGVFSSQVGIAYADEAGTLPPLEDKEVKLPDVNGNKTIDENKQDTKELFSDLKFFSQEGMQRGKEATKPLVKIISYFVSAAIYIIFVFSLVLIVPDLLYMQFPFMRRLLGGPDGASMEGAGSPNGYSGSPYGGGYGYPNAGNADPKRNRLGGLVTDDAKRIVKDQSITNKFGHYIVARVVNFVALGVCSVVLLSSMWFGYGFWIGEMVLEGVSYLFSMFGG